MIIDCEAGCIDSTRNGCEGVSDESDSDRSRREGEIFAEGAENINMDMPEEDVDFENSGKGCKYKEKCIFVVLLILLLSKFKN